MTVKARIAPVLASQVETCEASDAATPWGDYPPSAAVPISPLARPPIGIETGGFSMRCLLAVGAVALALVVGQAQAADGPEMAGVAVYQKTCAACHDGGDETAPELEQLLTLGRERVSAALKPGGLMASQASKLTPAQHDQLVAFLTVPVEKRAVSVWITASIAKAKVPAIAGSALNELIFPIGCALVIYLATHASRHLSWLNPRHGASGEPSADAGVPPCPEGRAQPALASSLKVTVPMP